MCEIYDGLLSLLSFSVMKKHYLNIVTANLFWQIASLKNNFFQHTSTLNSAETVIRLPKS